MPHNFRGICQSFNTGIFTMNMVVKLHEVMASRSAKCIWHYLCCFVLRRDGVYSVFTLLLGIKIKIFDSLNILPFF